MKPPQASCQLAAMLLIAAALCACGGGSAPARLLGTTPTAVPRASSLAQLNMDLSKAAPLDCTVSGGSAQTVQSNLRFTGPCAYTEQSGVACSRKIDDFYVYIKHSLPGNGSFIVSINVEKYKGPGDYTNATQVFVEAARGPDIYPWSQLVTSSRVAPDGRHVHLEETDVPPQSGTQALGVEHIGGDVYCAT